MPQRMAQFHKVGFEQFLADWKETFPSLMDEMDAVEVERHVREIYDNIQLPKRGTAQSAGHDFYSPISFTVSPSETIKIPTGIQCEMYDGWVLMMYPRSGLGTKFGFVPRNLTGIVDGDYIDADNEGHIAMIMVNNGDKDVKIKAGQAFCQGMFVQYGITIDDEVKVERFGGFGSTDLKSN